MSCADRRSFVEAPSSKAPGRVSALDIRGWWLALRTPPVAHNTPGRATAFSVEQTSNDIHRVTRPPPPSIVVHPRGFGKEHREKLSATIQTGFLRTRRKFACSVQSIKLRSTADSLRLIGTHLDYSTVSSFPA